jgi:hypothetical protein
LVRAVERVEDGTKQGLHRLPEGGVGDPQGNIVGFRQRPPARRASALKAPARRAVGRSGQSAWAARRAFAGAVLGRNAPSPQGCPQVSAYRAP